MLRLRRRNSSCSSTICLLPERFQIFFLMMRWRISSMHSVLRSRAWASLTQRRTAGSTSSTKSANSSRSAAPVHLEFVYLRIVRYLFLIFFLFICLNSGLMRLFFNECYNYICLFENNDSGETAVHHGIGFVRRW